MAAKLQKLEQKNKIFRHLFTEKQKKIKKIGNICRNPNKFYYFCSR